ncbi:MAG: hypothetical protein ACK5XA_08590 [Tagaea sp.]
MSKDTGGPAFPATIPGPNGSGVVVSGMTLRDWYAGKTLEGLLSSPIGEGGEPATVALAGPLGQYIADSLSIVSFRVADAMIKERSK